MKKKTLLWIASLVMMGVSVFGYYQFIQATKSNVEMRTTIKPTRFLKSSEVIERSMLQEVVIANEAHSANAILDVDQLIGLTVVVPISEQEEFLPWKLSKKEIVPKEGERYFSFKTDQIANVNNMVRKGDRVDVWVEFDTPKRAVLNGQNWHIGAIKIIEGLMVSSVKNAEGIEITDEKTISVFSQSEAEQLRNDRGKATGKAEQNTYIMNDDIYTAYVLGSIGGKVKLALPNLAATDSAEAKVTDVFQNVNGSSIFIKGMEEDQVINFTGEVSTQNVRGSQVEKEDEKSSFTDTQDTSSSSNVENSNE